MFIDGFACAFRRFQQQIKLRQFIASQGKTFQHGNSGRRKLLLRITSKLRNKE